MDNIAHLFTKRMMGRANVICAISQSKDKIELALNRWQAFKVGIYASNRMSAKSGKSFYLIFPLFLPDLYRVFFD